VTTPTPKPAPPAVPPPASASLGCSYAGCTVAPLVQWQRRPTVDELAAVVTVEQSRRDALLAAADPQQLLPEFGPLSTAADTCIAVFACGPHAISMDLAALIHAADCTAPDPAVLPGCNCTPEPAPAPEPMLSEAQALPDHWQ
jgi:hypothetical protein